MTPVTPPEPTDREALREAVDKAIDRTFDRWSAGVLPNELLRERTRRTIRAALELVELERLDRTAAYAGAIRDAVETEWYNGNISETVRDRILRPGTRFLPPTAADVRGILGPKP